jgi:hypothetical protein
MLDSSSLHFGNVVKVAGNADVLPGVCPGTVDGRCLSEPRLECPAELAGVVETAVEGDGSDFTSRLAE